MNSSYQKFIKEFAGNNVFNNVNLAQFSSFKIGGPADLLVKTQNTDELIKAVNVANKFKIKYFIIGGGTNLLISDAGFRGLIIKNDSNRIKIVGLKGGNNKSDKALKMKSVYLEADSGVGTNRLVRFSIDQGFSGLEAFLGQPGTVGGAIYINAHNMNMRKFIGDCVFSVKLLDPDGNIKDVDNNYMKFGYDESVIQKTKETVISCIFKLNSGVKEALWKTGQLASDYRRDSQPVGYYSSGCTFRNISQSDAVRLATPNYTRSVGYLLDAVGLRGKKIGNVMFSEKHANFIVHRGGVMASDVIKLINLAKELVKKKFNIALHEEIVLLGIK